MNDNQNLERTMDETMIREFSQRLAVRASAKRAAGRHGWHDPGLCTIEYLESLLKAQIEKPELDPLDIGLLAGMVAFRRGRVTDDQTKNANHCG